MGLLRLAAKQQRLAREVFTCYEAGAFGYGLHWRLSAMGVTYYVVQPQDWNESGKEVKNDRLDDLAVPTEDEEREHASSFDVGKPRRLLAARSRCPQAGFCRFCRLKAAGKCKRLRGPQAFATAMVPTAPLQWRNPQRAGKCVS